jgi:hypothetical protein
MTLYYMRAGTTGITTGTEVGGDGFTTHEKLAGEELGLLAWGTGVLVGVVVVVVFVVVVVVLVSVVSTSSSCVSSVVAVHFVVLVSICGV